MPSPLSKSLNGTWLRLLSAAIGLIILFSLKIFVGPWGLKALCLLAVLLGIRELVRFLFKPQDPFLNKALFWCSILSVFLLTTQGFELALLSFPAAVVLLLSWTMWRSNTFSDLGALNFYQQKSLLGMVYLGLMPAMACRLIDLNHGPLWFIALLAFVFAGDSCAYFLGMFMGKNLLMPEISPKKTIEGALGGLLGSMLAAVVIVAVQSDLPFWPVVGLALVSGAVGQMGDLYESLLKRVANQKDSGTLMPGHGGVLDRIDGVLFASPIVLVGATLIERYFVQK